MSKVPYHFRLTAGDTKIAPEMLDLKDLCALMDKLSDFVRNGRSLPLNLIGIRDKCIDIELLTPDEYHDSWSDLNNPDLTGKRRALQLEISALLGKTGTQADVYLRDEWLARVEARSENHSLDPIITATMTLYGEVVGIGGSRYPKLKLKLHEGYTVECSLSRDHAIALGHRLYEVVALRGVAKHNLSGRIQEFQVEQILDFKETSMLTAMEILSDEFGGAFGGCDETYFQRVRCD